MHVCHARTHEYMHVDTSNNAHGTCQGFIQDLSGERGGEAMCSPKKPTPALFIHKKVSYVPYMPLAVNISSKPEGGTFPGGLKSPLPPPLACTGMYVRVHHRT